MIYCCVVRRYTDPACHVLDKNGVVPGVVGRDNEITDACEIVAVYCIYPTVRRNRVKRRTTGARHKTQHNM